MSSSGTETQTESSTSEDFTDQDDQEPQKQVKTRTAAKSRTTTKTASAKTISNTTVATAEDQFQVHEIDALQKQGAATADIGRLRESGIETIEGFLMRTKKQLMDIKGLSEAKVDKLIIAANQALGAKKIITADEVLQKRKNLIRISTGSSQFDQMMAGGLQSQQICEVFGEFRCGKSQLCHTLAVLGQHPIVDDKQSAAQYKTIYIDTESTFRPDRIQQIAEFHKLDPKQALKNIFVSRCYNHEQQMQVLSLLPQLLVKEKFSLIILDSITALFRVDFQGRGELADRQQTLGKHLSQLQKLSEEFNLLIFITNQVMADPSGAVFIANASKPIGGNILAHASTTRIMLKKGRGETRVAKIYDSPELPEGECTFAIAKGGIVDAEE